MALTLSVTSLAQELQNLHGLMEHTPSYLLEVRQRISMCFSGLLQDCMRTLALGLWLLDSKLPMDFESRRKEGCLGTCSRWNVDAALSD